MGPVFSARPWGGERLRTVLGKAAPKGEKIGESWEISDHPNGRSTIASGPHAGRLFGDLLAEAPRALCGVDRPPSRYPLLVKYIDAAEPLSIQVHPDDEQARAAGERGKTECWYILDCAAGTEVILGLNPGVGPEELRRGAADGSIEAMIARRPIRPGSFVYVPAGTVHALLAGTLLCEIEQASDLTYRLWDWNRKSKRELHVEEAIEATRFDASLSGSPERPSIIETESMADRTELITNPYFSVTLRSAAPGSGRQRWRFENAHGLIANVVGGEGQWGPTPLDESGCERLRLGQTWFLPAGLEELEVRPGAGGLRVLVSSSREIG